jgi:protein SCO1/2
MKRLTGKIYRLALASLLLVVISGCGGANLNTDPKDEAPEFELEQINGEKMSLSDTEGKVRLVYFYFSSCVDVCLPTTHLLSKVQEELKQAGVFAEDTAILSITFDPERDTQERLKEFSGFYDADSTGWHFLRGEEQYSRDLAKKYGVMVVDSGDGQFIHSNIILLVNQKGYIQSYYNANDLDLDASKIAGDMMDLLK